MWCFCACSLVAAAVLESYVRKHPAGVAPPGGRRGLGLRIYDGKQGIENWGYTG